jgi:hypothetical protein
MLKTVCLERQSHVGRLLYNDTLTYNMHNSLLNLDVSVIMLLLHNSKLRSV